MQSADYVVGKAIGCVVQVHWWFHGAHAITVWRWRGGGGNSSFVAAWSGCAASRCRSATSQVIDIQYCCVAVQLCMVGAWQLWGSAHTPVQYRLFSTMVFVFLPGPRPGMLIQWQVNTDQQILSTVPCNIQHCCVLMTGSRPGKVLWWQPEPGRGIC